MAKKETKDKIVREFTGEVQKISGSKTIRVQVETKFAHPIYERILKSHKTYIVHIENEKEVQVGDTVLIQETKPISKKKSFIFVAKVK